MGLGVFATQGVWGGQEGAVYLPGKEKSVEKYLGGKSGLMGSPTL